MSTNEAVLRWGKRYECNAGTLKGRALLRQALRAQDMAWGPHGSSSRATLVWAAVRSCREFNLIARWDDTPQLLWRFQYSRQRILARGYP